MASKRETIDWTKRRAPSLAELEEIADAAYSRLPAPFRKLTGDVVIRIEDFPIDEVLDSLGIESPFDLLGLYSGVDLARKSVMDVSALPDVQRRMANGPAVVAEPDATMWLPDGWIARPEALGAWGLRREGG